MTIAAPEAPESATDTAAAQGADPARIEQTQSIEDALVPLPDVAAAPETSGPVSDAANSVADTASANAEETGEQAQQLVNNIQDISFGQIGLIILLAWFGTYLARKLLPYLAERGPSQTRLYLLGAVPIIRLILLIFAILWIIPLIFNITFQNFLLIAGAASVAIGFALKDFASSLIAGIVAIFERPYRPGDWVQIDGDYGEVRKVGLRAIQLQIAADNTITVPHDRIWTNNISNANDGARTLMCIADFYLAPGHDGATIRSALFDIAITSAYLAYDKPVLVMLGEKPWGTHYKLKAYPFDMRDQFSFISDMTVRGKKAIAGAGGMVVTAPVAATGEGDIAGDGGN